MPTGTMTRQLLKKVWTDTDSLATTLLILFIDTYGTEGLTWSAPTILIEVNEDFGVQTPQTNFDKLMAAVNIVLSDDFYKSLPDFISFCNVLSGGAFDPSRFDPADIGEIAWGMTEAMLIEPPEDLEEAPFTPEIQGYVGEMLKQEGLMTPPDVLRIGMRNPELAAKVQGEWSDDPVMFNAIYDMEASKTEDINREIKDKLRTLSQQLESLPLDDGDTRDVVSRMVKALQTGSAKTAANLLTRPAKQLRGIEL